MSKYSRIKSYSPKKTSKAPKTSKKRGPISTFFIARWKWFKGLSKPKKVAVIGGPIAAFLILTPLLTYIYFANTISNPDTLMNYNNTGVVLLDKAGEPFYSFGTADRGERLPLNQISDFTEKALISSEDKNFYNHGGFSLISIVGALYANVLSGDATGYGGSTLTQQLAKNTLLSNNQTVLRKYQELTIALAIEQKYSKDEILDLYLNSVYYGEGAFGIGAAAKAYYGKSAADLTLAESAMLVGVLPAPSAYSPISGNPEYAKERQATVLARMVDNKVISQAEADAAKAEVIAYAPQGEGLNSTAPHFAEMVLDELYDKYGEERVTRSGFRVTTSLDASLQKSANKAVDKQMNFIQRNGGSNASVVAIDPTSGELRALVGSADYENADFGKVNMATTARQPGSSIKPLYYAEAMQRGIISPATILQDKATNFGGYQPQNADRRFRGDITVRNAISQSLNIPSVEVMQKLGVSNAVDAFKRMGLSTVNDSTDYGLSLALGSAEAKLTDMTNVYAAFGNAGNQYGLTTITKIDDKFEKQVFSKSTSDPKRVMGENASFLISDILNDESARAPTFGTSLNTNGYDVAVKTGTTDEARDAWTIGYSKQLAVGVWVGNNDNAPMKNGGSSMAGPIWRSTITAGMKGIKNTPFTAPAGVERLTICRSNGQLATGGGTEGTYQEYFLRTAAPTGTCNVPKPPVDTDADGVVDENDECANTPSGTAVDATGCEIPEEEDRMLDTDNDGIIDENDRCANTPAGSTVDATGCVVTTPGTGSGTGSGNGSNTPVPPTVTPRGRSTN
jgi:1A family penicillin-binding protein